MSQFIKNVFNNYTENAKTLEDVKIGIFKALDRIDLIESTTYIKRGYVSGILTTDGKDMINTNFARLEGYTEIIRGMNNFTIFSLTDIFNNTLMSRFVGISQENWRSFWKCVIENGNITDIFMTPRWRESNGAIDEYTVARKRRVHIHNMEHSEQLMDLLRKY